jgi:hypothetical protein
MSPGEKCIIPAQVAVRAVVGVILVHNATACIRQGRYRTKERYMPGHLTSNTTQTTRFQHDFSHLPDITRLGPLVIIYLSRPTA